MNMGPCGIVCTICLHYRRGLCEGCIRGDLCPLAKALLNPCPVLRCAAARKIPYCARDCPNFPCALFERHFPRCWVRMDSQRQAVTLLGDDTPISPPIPEPTLSTKKPERDGLRIYCLGTFRVYKDSEEIQDKEWGQGKGPTQKIKAMFAYLLSRKDCGARKDTLIDVLWPDQIDHDRIGTAFHPTLHYLRRALEPDLKSDSASSYIHYENGRYYFDPLKPYWLDSDAFEAYCRRAEKSDQHGEAETAMLYWGMALDLYQGDYMAGIDPDYTGDRTHDWCMPRRRHLRELYLAALMELAHYHCDRKEYALCIESAQKILEIEPDFELAHRLAMQCLFRGGHLDRAMHQFDLCEAALARYQDSLPTDQTKQLYEQIMECTQPNND